MLRPGASQEDWSHFAYELGLIDDLLPVVSDPEAKISPNSKMTGVGKTPSVFNRSGYAVGIPDWTSRVTTMEDIAEWKRNPRLGICLQTRRVRAIDIDIDHPQAEQVVKLVESVLGPTPLRYRANSKKCLLAFELLGEYTKRVIKTEHGIIEFLASGQQFIATGTHTSGVRYAWTSNGKPGLPDSLPIVAPEVFERLWLQIGQSFGTDAQSSSAQKPATDRRLQLTEAIQNDEVAMLLYEAQMVHSVERDGRMHIVCPFDSEHTTESPESATTYFPANTGGFALGHFKCLHAHCSNRTDEDFRIALGVPSVQFDDLTLEEPETPLLGMGGNASRFNIVPAHVFAVGTPPSWIVKNVLPEAELGVVFGDSGSGKTFATLDLVACIALGEPWRGIRTKQKRVVYIAAEGSGGFRKRLKAFAMARGIPLSSIDLHVLADVPNFMQKEDAIDLSAAIQALGDVGLVVVDTWAQTTAGGNENAGEDMGLALKHCRTIHKDTGAMIILIHHSGKNSSAGARGWSGLRAAADVEIEVLQDRDVRCLSVTKQKDGEAGIDYGFKLKVIEVEIDEDGDPVESCVIEPVDVTPGVVRTQTQIGPRERSILEVVRTLLAEGSLPDLAHVCQSVAETEPADPDDKRDRRGEKARRSVRRMIEKGLLGEIEGRIGIVGEYPLSLAD